MCFWKFWGNDMAMQILLNDANWDSQEYTKTNTKLFALLGRCNQRSITTYTNLLRMTHFFERYRFGCPNNIAKQLQNCLFYSGGATKNR